MGQPLLHDLVLTEREAWEEYTHHRVGGRACFHPTREKGLEAELPTGMTDARSSCAIHPIDDKHRGVGSRQ